MLKHVAGLWETAGVPGEIPLAIGMLNVQPDDIARQVVVIKALIHFQNVSLIPIVPAALVVAEGEERGQCLGPCRFGVGGGRGHSGVRLNLEPMEMPGNSGRYTGTGPENRPRHRTAENAQSPTPTQGDKDQESRLQAHGVGAPHTCETSVLPEDIEDRGPEHQEDIDDAALRHPANIRLWSLPRALQVVQHLPKQGLQGGPERGLTPPSRFPSQCSPECSHSRLLEPLRAGVKRHLLSEASLSPLTSSPTHPPPTTAVFLSQRLPPLSSSRPITYLTSVLFLS